MKPDKSKAQGIEKYSVELTNDIFKVATKSSVRFSTQQKRIDHNHSEYRIFDEKAQRYLINPQLETTDDPEEAFNKWRITSKELLKKILNELCEGLNTPTNNQPSLFEANGHNAIASKKLTLTEAWGRVEEEFLKSGIAPEVTRCCVTVNEFSWFNKSSTYNGLDNPTAKAKKDFNPILNDEGEIIKYKLPKGVINKDSHYYFLPKFDNPSVLHKLIDGVIRRHNLNLNSAQFSSYSEFFNTAKMLIPVGFSEGYKKAIKLICEGELAFSFTSVTTWGYKDENEKIVRDNDGVKMLNPQIKELLRGAKSINNYFDHDEKTETIKNIDRQSRELAYAIYKELGIETNRKVWLNSQGKGIDDYLANGNSLDTIKTIKYNYDQLAKEFTKPIPIEELQYRRLKKINSSPQDNSNPDKYLIPEILPKGELIQLIAAPKVGKTLFANDLMCSLIKGECFLGYGIKQENRKVLLIQLDETLTTAETSITQRLGQCDCEELSIDSFGWKLNQDGVDQLRCTLEKLDPSLVVIDSIRASTTGLGYDENSAAIADPILKIRDLIKERNINGIMIHHSNKSNDQQGTNKSRGSSAIAAAFFATWLLTPLGEDMVRLNTYGRCAPKEFNLSLNPDELRFEVIEEGSSTIIIDDIPLSKQLREIIPKLVNDGVNTLKEINNKISCHPDTLRKNLNELVKAGVLIRFNASKTTPATYSLYKKTELTKTSTDQERSSVDQVDQAVDQAETTKNRKENIVDQAVDQAGSSFGSSYDPYTVRNTGKLDLEKRTLDQVRDQVGMTEKKLDPPLDPPSGKNGSSFSESIDIKELQLDPKLDPHLIQLDPDLIQLDPIFNPPSPQNFRAGELVKIKEGLSYVGELAKIEEVWTGSLVLLYPNGDRGTKHFEDVELITGE